MNKLTKEKETIVNEIHKPARRNFLRRRTILRGIDDLWQSDLIELTNYSRFNRGYKYILIVIDCFSKYIWTHPLKNKSGNEVTNAFEIILKSHPHRIPKNLQTDNGKEYYNKTFNSLMKKYNINHYSTFSTMKASMAERVIRTIKEKLFKLFNLYGNYKWAHLIDSLTESYNNTKHRTIGMKPIEVNNKTVEEKLLNTVYSNLKVADRGKFKIGDIVRISKFKHMFNKGYTPNWTTEQFKIIKVQITNPVTYLLEDMQGNRIQGAFYQEELSKTALPGVYLVEKVLKKKGNQLFVSWLGFNKAHNSWIPKTNIV
jgi:hypothetical protein